MMECLVRRQRLQRPEAIAVYRQDQQVSWRMLDRIVTRLQQQLDRAGVTGPDCRVVFYLADPWQGLCCLLALLRQGAVFCPLNHRMPEQALAEHSIKVGSQFIIADSDRQRQTLQARLPTSQLLCAASMLAAASSDSLSRDRQTLPAASWPATDQQIASLLATSGTSGPPKLVAHGLEAHLGAARGWITKYPLEPDDCWLLTLPLCHVSGLGIVFRWLVAGAALAVPASGEDPFVFIERGVVTHASLVATQLVRLVERSLPGVRWRQILLGGSPFPVPLLEAALEQQLPLYLGYGMTEMAGTISCSDRLRSVDDCQRLHALPGREVKVDGDGMIRVRGASRMLGYWRNQQLDKPFDHEGWLRTGDLGVADGKGRVRVSGRQDNCFISGGENISPELLESTILATGLARHCLIVPVEDRVFGQRPAAFIQMCDKTDPEALVVALQASLPRFMLPSHYLPWPDGADTGGKPDRRWFTTLARQLVSPSLCFQQVDSETRMPDERR